MQRLGGEYDVLVQLHGWLSEIQQDDWLENYVIILDIYQQMNTVNSL